MQLRFLTPFLLCFISTFIHAQVFIMEDGANVFTCNGTFLDPGGASGDYPSDTNMEALICSDSPSNPQVRLNFQELNLAVGDSIRFFDGLDSDASLLEVPVDIYDFEPFAIAASVENASGCILIQFTSDATEEATGWIAEMQCQPLCQRIITDIIPISDSPDEEDDIYYYCVGDTASFFLDASFPDNGILYQQSLKITNFEWRLNGVSVAENQIEVNLPLEDPGTANLRLHATDQMGCTNLVVSEVNFIVSPGPELSIDESLNLAICAGETVELFTYTYLENPLPGIGITAANIPGNSILQNELLLDEPEILPDGSGFSIRFPLMMTNSPAGAEVSQITRIDSVWFDIEHSYSGDLDVEVICPDGTTVAIIEYPSGLGSTNFGEPFASGPVDNESSDETPGITYRYNVVNDGAPTFSEVDQMAPTYTYTTVPSNLNGNTYTYMDTYFPAGTYRTEQPFSEFIGCPLNGEWSLRLQDNLGLDNGHLSGWGIAFTGATQDSLETTVTWQWEANPAIINEDENSIEVLIPETPGPTEIALSAVDNYGCSTDIVYTITHASELLCNGFSPTVPDIGLDPQPWPPTPNPFNDEINLHLNTSAKAYDCRIISANGQEYFAGTLDQPTAVITERWPSGIYFVQIFGTEEEGVKTYKIVKQ